MRDFSNDHSAIALNTATLGHMLEGHGAGWEAERVVDECAARGFGGIVFWRKEVAGKAVAIGERVRASGMTVVGLCRSPFLVGPHALPSRSEILNDFRALIDTAAELGAGNLTVVVGGVEPGTRGQSESLKLAADRIGEVAPYALDLGVNLALEPLHPVYAADRSCLATMRDAVDMCLSLAAPNVGVAADVYHVWWDGSLGAELARVGAEKIFGYHLCDWLSDTSDFLLDRGMMGDGVADLRGIRRSVEGAGYGGLCEVEVFSAENWWKRNPGEVLDTCVERFRTVC